MVVGVRAEPASCDPSCMLVVAGSRLVALVVWPLAMLGWLLDWPSCLLALVCCAPAALCPMLEELELGCELVASCGVAVCSPAVCIGVAPELAVMSLTRAASCSVPCGSPSCGSPNGGVEVEALSGPATLLIGLEELGALPL